MVGRHRGHRPAARRCRHRGAGRGPGQLHRSCRRPARLSCSAATPARTPRSPPPRRQNGSGWGCGWPLMCWAGSPPTVMWSAESSPRPSRRQRPVVRRRGAADPAQTVAGGAARTGRTGKHRRLRAFPARLATDQRRDERPEQFRLRRACSPWSTSSPVSGFPPRRVEPLVLGAAGARLLSPPCSTSCWRPAR